MFYYQKKGIPSENPFLFRKELGVFLLFVIIYVPPIILDS